MNYTYICPIHGEFSTNLRADWDWCNHEDGYVVCAEAAKRVWHFRVDVGFEPYYAPSFGTVVRSRTHAKDLAKIASEEATLRTGIESSYTVVDTHDDAAVGIDTEEKKHYGEETRRHAVNGAAWSAERRAELQAERDRLRAEKDQAKVDA